MTSVLYLLWKPVPVVCLVEGQPIDGDETRVAATMLRYRPRKLFYFRAGDIRRFASVVISRGSAEGIYVL